MATSVLSVLVLIIATVFIALEADLVSGALEETAETIGVSPHSSASSCSRWLALPPTSLRLRGCAAQGRMNLVLNICIGSAIQVALVVAPLLVIGSSDARPSHS